MPGGRERIAKKPASLVCVLEAKLVAALTIVTLAPGTTDPEGSATVPESEPVAMPCENPEAASNRQNMHTSSADHNWFGRNIDSTSETLFFENRVIANSFISFAPIEHRLSE